MPKGGAMATPAPNPMAGILGGGAPRQQAGGLFGPMTPDRYEMIMDLLAASMSGAAQSNSPAAAFLAPIVGSVVGMGAEKKRDAYTAQLGNQGVQTLLGRSLTPAEQQAVQIVGDPNTPDYLKAIARTMLPKAGASSGGSTGGGSARRRSSGVTGAARPAKLTYISRDPDGVVRGYNAATGKREVVPNADSPAVSGQPVVPGLPPNPPDPVLPRDPGTGPAGVLDSPDLSGLSDEDLISRYR